jgi:hypothetical protein
MRINAKFAGPHDGRTPRKPHPIAAVDFLTFGCGPRDHDFMAPTGPPDPRWGGVARSRAYSAIESTGYGFMSPPTMAFSGHRNQR